MSTFHTAHPLNPAIMAGESQSFNLMTALTYSPSRPDEPFSLLNRHLARLRDAHAAFARELPDCWCASTSMPDDAAMRKELERAVEEAKASGKEGDLRVRARFRSSRSRRDLTMRLRHSPDTSVHPTDWTAPRRMLSFDAHALMSVASFRRTAARKLTCSLQADPVRLVLDDRPTEYGEPFLRYKTSQREVYDEARRRQGALVAPCDFR